MSDSKDVKEGFGCFLICLGIASIIFAASFPWKAELTRDQLFELEKMKIEKSAQ